jgi:hypothetical protein
VDHGYPNVRAVNDLRETTALEERYTTARELAQTKQCLTEFNALVAAIQEHSGVVIAVECRFALNFINDEKQLYTGQERLVDAGTRTPPRFADDSHRRVVSGTLFASYGDRIVYGVLSLSNKGLSTYGKTYMRLRTVAIDERTSFLEVNSYKLPSPGSGQRADWKRRHMLVAAKLVEHLVPGQALMDWERLLVASDGGSKDNDAFVEAHVFDGFNCGAVESIDFASSLDGDDRKLARMIEKAFRKRSGAL